MRTIKTLGVLSLSETLSLTASERAARVRAGYVLPMAGADPALADPLVDRLKKVDGTLGDLRTDAGAKWRKLEETKQAVGKVEGDLSTDHPAFKALDEAGKDYGRTQDMITEAENVKATLIDNLTRMGAAVPEEVKGRGLDERYLDTPAGQRALKAAGERVIASAEYKSLQGDPALMSTKTPIGVKRLGQAYDREETKALLVGASPSSAGAFVVPDRQGYYGLPLRPLTLLDLITLGQTDSDTVEFVRQTAFTNAAAGVAEAQSSAKIGDGTGGTTTAVLGGRKPESSMAFEVVKETTKTIAHWMPSTRRALRDAGQLRTIIDLMLSWGLDATLEAQIATGNGVGENLLGIYNTPGINSIPAGATSKADKVHMGMTQVRLDMVEPTGTLINPLDWEDIRLSRENTGGDGTGGYLFGPPSTQGAQTLWGAPVAVSASAPQGSGMVGAFRAAIFWLQEGTSILASDSHEDFFTRNLIAILAEMVGAFGVPMPQSFSEIDFAAS